MTWRAVVAAGSEDNDGSEEGGELGECGHVVERSRSPMNAGSKGAMRNAGHKPDQGFDWHGGALIRCIGCFGNRALFMISN